MQVTGMLDSPFVRRVVVTLLKWGLPFQHRPISLFRHIDAFSAVSPLLKAPTVTTDNGAVLVESSVILATIAAIHPQLPPLWPSDPTKRIAAASLSGVALVVGEKAVQLYYEGTLRPPQAQFGPWRDRVAGQLDAGLRIVEDGVPAEGWIGGGALGQADIDVACMVEFARAKFPERVGDIAFPRLLAFCSRAEALPEFLAAPPVDGVVAPVKSK